MRPDPWSKEHVDEINLAIARRAWVMRRCHDEILKNFTEPETGQVVMGGESSIIRDDENVRRVYLGY